jgi:uncharacterized membrane protein
MTSLITENVAHLHLLLNHVPTVGAVVALGLLLLAFVRRDEPLKHAGLEVLFVIAVVTLPVYTSGVAAHLTLRDRQELSDNAIRVHQDAAVAGFAVTEFAGFVAWTALWQTRRRGRAARGLVPAVTLLSIVALALMARAATLGGEIRHPEIRTDLSAGAVASSEDPERFLTTKISMYMVNSPWAWPAAETVHFLGLSLSFGVLLTVNLRILGVMKKVAFADLHRLLPWGMLGFGANLITGMLFFIGQPRQYIESAPFYWKVVFLMIAGANFLYLTVFKKAWAPNGEVGDVGFDSSLADKAMAVSSIVAWLAVLYAGRMLPFIGRAF